MKLEVMNPDPDKIKDLVDATNDIRIKGSIVLENMDADAIGTLVEELEAGTYNLYEDEDDELENPIPKEKRKSKKPIKKETPKETDKTNENEGRKLPKPKNIKEEKEIYEEPDELNPEEVNVSTDEEDMINEMKNYLKAQWGEYVDEPRGHNIIK